MIPIPALFQQMVERFDAIGDDGLFRGIQPLEPIIGGRFVDESGMDLAQMIRRNEGGEKLTVRYYVYPDGRSLLLERVQVGVSADCRRWRFSGDEVERCSTRLSWLEWVEQQKDALLPNADDA